jgi:hypothetical protein
MVHVLCSDTEKWVWWYSLGLRIPPPSCQMLWLTLSAVIINIFRKIFSKIPHEITGSLVPSRFNLIININEHNRHCTSRINIFDCTRNMTYWYRNKFLLMNNSMEHVLTEKLKVSQLLKKLPALYGHRIFVTLLTRIATGPYSEPNASSPHPPPHFSKVHCNIIFTSTPRSSKFLLPFRF